MKITIELTAKEYRELLPDKDEGSVAEHINESLTKKISDHFINESIPVVEVKEEAGGIRVAADASNASDNFKEFIDNITKENDVDPKPEKPVIKRSTTKIRLDDGKIYSLRRAGWAWERIAEEMSCSIQTAINHYNEYAKER